MAFTVAGCVRRCVRGEQAWGGGCGEQAGGRRDLGGVCGDAIEELCDRVDHDAGVLRTKWGGG